MEHNFTHCIPLQKTSAALPSVKLPQEANKKIWINKQLNACRIHLLKVC